MLMEYFDVHTHHTPLSSEQAIYACSIKDVPLVETKMVSVGIHPWNLTEENAELQFHWLEEAVKYSNVVAIGECGMDKLHGISMVIQSDIFKKCIELSERTSLPVIIHAVKCTEELIRIKKDMRPQSPWIIHGFRGNALVAKSLLHQGFYLSFGEYYQEESMRCTPLDRLFLETDESCIPIEYIYRKAALNYGIPLELLMESITSNAKKFLFLR